MRQGLRLVIVLPAAALLATGCATRDWVRETLGKKEVEFDQRVEGMGFRLAETGTVALGARDRADAAFAKADDVSSRLTRLWSARHERNLVEAVQVRFGFDRWELNDTAQTALLTLIKELRENPRLSVDLEGYADPKGTLGYNVALSQRRVEAVRRYLVDKGVALPRIHSVGLGPVLDGGQPDEQKRRVSVKLMVQPD